ncbi:MAG: prolyl oligopeptidase family serine peptidase [Eggerthellaceae bacterium]|nr:prolyl oligopeptidase family serine peptidase [Eggerthellaceae bacterium]
MKQVASRLALIAVFALACALAACGCTSTTQSTSSQTASASASSAASASGHGARSGQASGAAAAGTNATFDEEAFVSAYAGAFEQKTYTDAQTGKSITYNVFLPKNYDASKSYPTVVFIADSSCAGADATRSLTQGLGALVWASDEWQAENECIVLVPTYPETILDDHSGYTTTDYVEMTKRFIDAMTSEYAIDTNRIYGTGQSMGCMTTLILASEYPDLYAACMFVDGQWDVSTLKGLESQKFVYFAAEDDNSAYKGMQEVMAMFDADGAAYTYQQWDATWNADELTSAAQSLFGSGTNANFVSWKTGTIPGSGSGAGVHMASFDYAYNCKSAMEWLFQQSKK